jgi:hypothetical protein
MSVRGEGAGLFSSLLFSLSLSLSHSLSLSGASTFPMQHYSPVRSLHFGTSCTNPVYNLQCYTAALHAQTLSTISRLLGPYAPEHRQFSVDGAPACTVSAIGRGRQC